jgi:hypothetical protein
MMIDRRLHGQDDAAPGCRVIGLVSYLETANARLRQAVEDLTRETAALRQQLEHWKSGGCAAGPAACPGAQDGGDPQQRGK